MNTSLKLLLLFTITLVLGACRDKFDDSQYRNENYVWWVDAKTGKASWIPIGHENPVKNGKGTRFYFNGKIYSKFRLVDGKEVDTTIYYNMISGQPMRYKIFKDNDTTDYFIHDGPLKMYSEKGELTGEGTIEHHDYGRFRKYYESGKLHVTYNLKNDTGCIADYYESGNMQDSNYQEGKGQSYNIKKWFENGQIKIIMTFKDHNFNGTMWQYYPDGKPYGRGTLAAGKFNGDFTGWFENGKIKAIKHFKMGEATGHQLFYYENGRIKMDCYSINGQLEGERKIYNEDGTLQSDGIFTNGALTQYIK